MTELRDTRSTRHFVPGAITAARDEVWMGDLTRSAVLRLDVTSGLSQVTRWDTDQRWEPGVGAASIAPTEGSCWVTGDRGVYLINPMSEVNLIDPTPGRETCLVDGTLYVLNRPSLGFATTQVRLVNQDGPLATVKLPGRVHSIAATDGAAQVVVRVKNPDSHAIAHKFCRVSPSGDNQIGPVLAVGAFPNRFTILDSQQALEVDRASGRTLLRTVDKNLALTASTEIVPVASTPRCKGVWSHRGRLFVTSRSSSAQHKKPVDLVEINTKTGAVLNRIALPWWPTAVTATDPDVWVQGFDTREATSPRHRLLHWSTVGLKEVDPTAASNVLFNLDVPLSEIDLVDRVTRTVSMFAKSIGSGSGALRPLSHYVVGSYPDTHAVFVFETTDSPALTVATAYPLFTVDGTPRQHPGQFHDVAVLERLRTGGIDDLRAQSPDASGLRWLDKPITREGGCGVTSPDLSPPR